MNERRGPWYLITGLVTGLLLGLAYAWVINPGGLVDTSPDRLAPAFKDHYRSMIALAFESNGDLGRARGRLGLLKDEDMVSELSAQAQRILAQGGSPQEAQALAALAAALGGPSPAPAATEPPENDAGARQEIPAPATVLTPGADANAAFALRQRDLLCDPSLEEGTLQIDVVDASGRPAPGVRIVIRWESGEETIATGLTPSISPGFADYVMRPGEVYRVQVGAGNIVPDLSTQSCPGSSGADFQGGWRLLFVQE
ncbi:MAG: hypothetical protein ROW39_12720 [Anaerolineaceae bacterium]|jgi:hypothetical protein